MEMGTPQLFDHMEKRTSLDELEVPSPDDLEVISRQNPELARELSDLAALDLEQDRAA
jgi:hypothetical protein